MVLKPRNYFATTLPTPNFAPGEMAERSNAAVLKTVDCNRSGGSNPSLSAGTLFKKYQILAISMVARVFYF